MEFAFNLFNWLLLKETLNIYVMSISLKLVVH